MDFETQKSDLKSTENAVPASSATTSIRDIKIESNGSIGHDDVHDLNTNGNGCSEPYLAPEELNGNDHENFDFRRGYGSLHLNRSMSGEYVDAVTAVSLINSGEKGAQGDHDVVDSCLSPPMDPSGMLPPISGKKGKGLRKWRRIRREFIKGGTAIKDSAKMLKRGSADLTNSSVAEVKQKSDSSESSVNEILHNVSNADAFTIDGSSSGYKFAGGRSTFSAGSTGSDEDRDSKSSTAASVPKPRNNIPRPSGYSWDKHKTKQVSGKHSGVGNVDTGKKPRNEAVSMDKENLLSSPESDSGSYSSVFTRHPSFGTFNGQGDSKTYEDEHGDDGPAGEKHSADTSKSVEDEKISKGDAVLSWKIRGRDVSGDWDPLVDCVLTLQSTQEALERELQKFGELGKDLRPFDEDSIRTSGIGPESCAPSYSDSPTSDFGTDIPDVLISLTKNIEIFEKQIEETKSMIKEKETKIAELHSAVNNLKSSNEDLQKRIDKQQKNYEEIEAEVETLCKEKMEAEIQYLAIADTSILAENQMKFLLTEQKSLVSAQAQEMQKAANLECRAANLKDKAEERLTGEKGTTGADPLKMRKGITKLTFCFVIQLILFFCMFELFISQFLSKTTVVLPT